METPAQQGEETEATLPPAEAAREALAAEPLRVPAARVEQVDTAPHQPVTAATVSAEATEAALSRATKGTEAAEATVLQRVLAVLAETGTIAWPWEAKVAAATVPKEAMEATLSPAMEATEATEAAAQHRVAVAGLAHLLPYQAQVVMAVPTAPQAHSVTAILESGGKTEARAEPGT